MTNNFKLSFTFKIEKYFWFHYNILGGMACVNEFQMPSTIQSSFLRYTEKNMYNNLPVLQTNDHSMYVNCGMSLQNSLTQYVKNVGIHLIISHLYVAV